MTEKKLKQLLDACFVAKRITETMTDLPGGMKPRHIHVIDAVYCLGKGGNDVRVGDVSSHLNITTPSVTKLINELVIMGVVQKSCDDDDKRYTFLRLTEKGVDCEKQYVTDYHAVWAAQMTEVTDEDASAAIDVIEKLRRAMPKGGGEHA